MVAAALVSPFREEYVRQQLQIYYQTRDLLWTLLNKFPWIECGKPMGAGFVFPDISKSGVDEDSFTRFLADRGIAPSVGTAWGPTYGKSHVRFAFCSPIDYQIVMNAKLEEALKEYEVLHKNQLIQ